MEWKNENTNLLIVTSAACSGETAGCQTLKGTGAEFNASCQGSLMWLSPPARAGIVKLSGAGKDAQTALRDAPLAVPTPGTLLRTQQGVGSIHHLHQGVCVYVPLCVCMRTCVNSGCVEIIVLQLLTISSPDAIEANGRCRDKTGAPHWPKNLCSRSRCCWLATYRLITF